jgi:hypothetical protein
MGFNKIDVSLLIDKMRNTVASGGPLEKDDGAGKPVTKRQFLNFIDSLSGGLTAIRKEIESLQDEITRLKSK